MSFDGPVPHMSDDPPALSRRQLLRYGGVGTALAVAGCGSNDDGTDDSGTSTDDGSGNGTDDGDAPSGGPAAEFDLAGDGATPYRQWLVPEYTLNGDSDVETKQLYQFNDYERASEAGWDSPLAFRDRFAEAYGVEAESFESEVLVGPVENGAPRRILFGSFDTTAIAEQLESNGFEQTGEDGAFTVYGNRVAVSEETIVQHSSFEAFLSASRAEGRTISDTDEDVALLLDLVPAGALVTLSRRDGKEDLVVDAMSVSEFGDDGVQSHAVRTLVFEEAAAVTDARIEELVIENSPFEEIVTQETDGRVAMAEVTR
jgi:hypothetical protein